MGREEKERRRRCGVKRRWKGREEGREEN